MVTFQLTRIVIFIGVYITIIVKQSSAIPLASSSSFSELQNNPNISGVNGLNIHFTIVNIIRNDSNDMNSTTTESLAPETLIIPRSTYNENLREKLDTVKKVLNEIQAENYNLSDNKEKNRDLINIQSIGVHYNTGIESKRSETGYPKNCKDIQRNGVNISGIYLIQPTQSDTPFVVLCDMTTRDGGWTYIQNRYDGSQDFFLNWSDYKVGFGNIAGEFWLGLDHIYQLTGLEINELLIELVALDGEKAYAHYAAFSIGSGLEGYALKVLGGYSGDAGDSFIYHAGSRFTTKDNDQDTWGGGNCADARKAAWWFKACDNNNLNGKYLNGSVSEDFIYQGMHWNTFKGNRYSMPQTRMLVRPRGPDSPPIFPNGVLRNINK